MVDEEGYEYEFRNGEWQKTGDMEPGHLPVIISPNSGPEVPIEVPEIPVKVPMPEVIIP